MDTAEVNASTTNAGPRILVADETTVAGMAYDLVEAFADHPNQALSRDRPLDLARDRGRELFEGSIDIRITRLPAKIEPDPAKSRTIETVRGRGTSTWRAMARRERPVRRRCRGFASTPPPAGDALRQGSSLPTGC